MNYIGIDPGVGGGLAVVSGGGAALAIKMPETKRDVCDWLRLASGSVCGPDAIATLEFVRSSPQMGVTSAFTFGRGYGNLEMALVACGIPFDEVTPRKWQQAMRCLTGGDKNVSKARAQELFPDMKVTHYTSDALLLAEYCRRLHTGMLAW